jgi:hypothetical protein
MDKANIMIFAGLYLQKNSMIAAQPLQKFIKNHPSSGSNVAIEDIIESLGLLYFAGFLNLYNGAGSKLESIYIKQGV